MNIQVTVPIYNAYDTTRQCIESLLMHNVDDHVVLINDASSDIRIEELLIDLPRAWQVIHQKQNRGFVQTANRGLRLTEGHTVLLNADTLVTAGWLNRFREVIKQVPQLGTATPWSNNAEICSIPNTLANNPVPANINHVANTLFKQHRPTYPKLPTAVGFCMLIAAAAKQQVGYFDELTFGLGYGEENDYSLRVTESGLHNVLVDNCYVAHWGNRSFGEKNLRPNQSTMDRLLKKHPNYLSTIQEFIEKNPLKQLRDSIIDKISTF